VHFAYGARQVEAARHYQNHIGIGGRQVVPGVPPDVFRVCHCDEFGHPVGHRHQRLDPLDASEARTGRGSYGFRDGVHLRLEPRDEFVPAWGDIERLRHAADIFPDFRQRHRIQRYDGRPAGEPRGYGAFHIL